jgi:hypothetical protein
MKAKLIIAMMTILVAGAAHAKLPPPSDEAKAKAAEAKEKAEHGNAVAAYQLCKSQNRVAERYMKVHGKKGAPLPACQDPGPFKPTSAAAASAVVSAKK